MSEFLQAHVSRWVSVLCLSRQVFKKAPTHFPHFFRCVMESCLSGERLGLSLKEQTVLLLFLDHCFNSLVSSHTSLAVVLLNTWWHCCFGFLTVLRQNISPGVQLPSVFGVLLFHCLLWMKTNCFSVTCSSLQEVDLIREQVQKLVSLPMWMCLLPVNITASHTPHIPHHLFWGCAPNLNSERRDKKKKTRSTEPLKGHC